MTRGVDNLPWGGPQGVPWSLGAVRAHWLPVILGGGVWAHVGMTSCRPGPKSWEPVFQSHRMLVVSPCLWCLCCRNPPAQLSFNTNFLFLFVFLFSVFVFF